MRMAATTFDGALLIRNWLKRSRMNSGRRSRKQAECRPQIIRHSQTHNALSICYTAKLPAKPQGLIL